MSETTSAAVGCGEPVRVDVVSEGAVRVSHGYLYRRGDEIVAVCVDMESKYAECGGFSHADDEPPHVYLDATDDTLHVDADKSGVATVVAFPEFVGWKVFLTKVARYTLSVILVR